MDVIYRSKDGITRKTVDALDWLAQLTCHIPNRGEQMARCYGDYSNKCRANSYPLPEFARRRFGFFLNRKPLF
jgi:hypothetical protein